MSRLGRNPFDRKPRSAVQPPRPLRAVEFVRQLEEEVAKPTPGTQVKIHQHLLKFLFVDLRAESYVFGLKAYLLSLSLFE
jgi:hypothetical protein